MKPLYPAIRLIFLILLLSNGRSIGAAINYQQFSPAAGLNVVGSATESGGALRLTPAISIQAGAAWHQDKQQVRDGFETTFAFQITAASGPGGGGDGFAFVVQNVDGQALGADGGGLGFHGIPNSLAVAFDTYLLNEEQAFHVKVCTRGTGPNDASTAGALTSSRNVPDFRDGQAHQVKVRYGSGELTVYIDDMHLPVLSVAVDLAAMLDLDAGRAWVGFTAGTGESFENHDVLRWRFESFPGCLPFPPEFPVLTNQASAHWYGFDFDGRFVVWRDLRSGTNEEIYAYDMVTRREIKVADTPFGQKWNCSISDGVVAWIFQPISHDPNGHAIYVKDLTGRLFGPDSPQREVARFSAAGSLDIDGDWVAWSQDHGCTGGDVYARNLRTGETIALPSPATEFGINICGNIVTYISSPHVWDTCGPMDWDVLGFDLERREGFPLRVGPEHYSVSGCDYPRIVLQRGRNYGASEPTPRLIVTNLQTRMEEAVIENATRGFVLDDLVVFRDSLSDTIHSYSLATGNRCPLSTASVEEIAAAGRTVVWHDLRSPATSGSMFIYGTELPCTRPEGKLIFATADNRLQIRDTTANTTTAVPGLPSAQVPIVSGPSWFGNTAERIIFSGGIAHNSQVYCLTPDGANMYRVTDGSGNASSPDSPADASFVVFHEIYGHLARVDKDGSQRTNFAHRLAHTRVSLDGRYIVGANWAVPSYNSDFFVYDTLTGILENVTDGYHSGDDAFQHGDVSPDGARLVVSRVVRETGRSDIWVMNRDGSDPVNITPDVNGPSGNVPTWSRDGQWILFASTHDGSSDIWAMRPDGSKKMNLTRSLDVEEYGPADILPASPTIIAQPSSQTVSVGGIVTLSVEVAGCGPFGYQWERNGIAIAGARGSRLRLTSLSSGDAGEYRVRVSNGWGETISQHVTLTVLELKILAGLEVSGVVGRVYRIDANNDLSDPNGWGAVTNILLQSSPYLWIDLQSADHRHRFYRATVVP